jgi:hypothetical protein
MEVNLGEQLRFSGMCWTLQQLWRLVVFVARIVRHSSACTADWGVDCLWVWSVLRLRHRQTSKR